MDDAGNALIEALVPGVGSRAMRLDTGATAWVPLECEIAPSPDYNSSWIVGNRRGDRLLRAWIVPGRGAGSVQTLRVQAWR